MSSGEQTHGPTDCPFRILDFEHIQVQLQVGPTSIENIVPFLTSETARIRARTDGKIIEIKTIVLIDATYDELASPAVRRVQAEWINENRDLLSRSVQAFCLVVPNPIARGAVTAIKWMAPLPATLHLHPTMEQAIDWAIATIDRQGGDIPSELLMGGAELIERRRAELTPPRNTGVMSRLPETMVSAPANTPADEPGPEAQPSVTAELLRQEAAELQAVLMREPESHVPVETAHALCRVLTGIAREPWPEMSSVDARRAVEDYWQSRVQDLDGGLDGTEIGRALASSTILSALSKYFEAAPRAVEMVSAQLPREEAARVQQALMLEDPERLDAASVAVLTELLMKVARRAWSEMPLEDARRAVVALGDPLQLEQLHALRGTHTARVLDESRVLSVLRKHLGEAA